MCGRLEPLLLSRQRPNSVFYAETPFAGGDLHDSNWLTAVIHRALGGLFFGPFWLFVGFTYLPGNMRYRRVQDVHEEVVTDAEEILLVSAAD